MCKKRVKYLFNYPISDVPMSHIPKFHQIDSFTWVSQESPVSLQQKQQPDFKDWYVFQVCRRLLVFFPRSKKSFQCLPEENVSKTNFRMKNMHVKILYMWTLGVSVCLSKLQQRQIQSRPAEVSVFSFLVSLLEVTVSNLSLWGFKPKPVRFGFRRNSSAEMALYCFMETTNTDRGCVIEGFYLFLFLDLQTFSIAWNFFNYHLSNRLFCVCNFLLFFFSTTFIAMPCLCFAHPKYDNNGQKLKKCWRRPNDVGFHH